MQYKVRFPHPFPHQQELVSNPSRFKLAVAGRRSGKSNALIQALCLGNSRYPGAVVRPGMYWWASPDHIQGRVATNFLRTALGNFARYNGQEHIFYLANTSQIHMKTADNDAGLRGEGLDGLIIDEAAFIREDRVKKSLLPSVTDKGGFCYLGTTPNGFDNWLCEFSTTQIAADPNWAQFSFPTWANPRISRASVEELRTTMGAAAFAQEHEGRFVASAAALFDSDWFSDVLVAELPSGFTRSVIAVDLSLGKLKSDWQAVVFAGVHQGLLYCDVYLYRVAITILLQHIEALYQQYRPEGVLFETNGFMELAADAFNQRFQDRLSPPVFHVTNTVDKAVRIGRLAPLLGQHKLKILDTPLGRKCVAQLRDFPAAQHDDAPDAIEMAYRYLVST